MNEGIQTVSFGKTHKLTARSTVSLEMPTATQKLQKNEGMPATARLEADFLRAEALLAEMREIRGCLEHSLQTLTPKD